MAVVTVFLLANSAARGKQQFVFLERVVTTVLAPVEALTAKLGSSLRQVTSFTGQIITVYRDNQALKTENEQLKQTNLDVAEVSAENARLRAMLDYKRGAPQFDFVVAAVIARDPSTWTSTIVINRGSQHGITKDMPVVTPQGLIGNVVQVYATSAKVQMILDPRSAVGALVQRPESRVAAIVEGNGANPLAPRMINLSRDADIIKGDKIITSGFGGIYPKGIVIGEVLDVINEEGGLLKYAILKPSVDFGKLEEVMVIVRTRETAPVPTPGQINPPPAAKEAPR